MEVVHADGAQFDLRPLFRDQPVKLLGNLPYSAGGAILAIEGRTHEPQPESMAAAEHGTDGRHVMVSCT